MQIKSYNFCLYSPYRLNDYMLPRQCLDKNTQIFVQNLSEKQKIPPKSEIF